MKRRQFLAASGAVIASSMAGSGAARAQEMLNPRNPNAVALGFHSQHSQVDAKKWRKKAGGTGESQRCGTCALFTATDGGKGSCRLFNGKGVPESGWCNGWTAR